MAIDFDYLFKNDLSNKDSLTKSLNGFTSTSKLKNLQTSPRN